MFYIFYSQWEYTNNWYWIKENQRYIYKSNTCIKCKLETETIKHIIVCYNTNSVNNMEIESKFFKLIKETTKETIKNKKQRNKITRTIYNNIIEDRYQSTQFYYDILINNLPEQKLNTIENTLKKNSKNFPTILTI